MSSLKYIKGLIYFLPGHNQNQKNIVSFINHCKSFEDLEGYLKQNFFETTNIKKGQFLSGPFAGILFDVINNDKNKFKILIGDIASTISKNSNCLYYPLS